MTLSSTEKEKVRVLLLLELNATFVRVSRHYTRHGTDEHREFLQTLIAEIRELVTCKPKITLSARSWSVPVYPLHGRKNSHHLQD